MKLTIRYYHPDTHEPVHLPIEAAAGEVVVCLPAEPENGDLPALEVGINPNMVDIARVTDGKLVAALTYAEELADAEPEGC